MHLCDTRLFIQLHYLPDGASLNRVGLRRGKGDGIAHHLNVYQVLEHGQLRQSTMSLGCTSVGRL